MTEQAEKTKMLQGQFICPIWAVWFGESVNVSFTRFHADQFMRALALNGTLFMAYDGHGEPVTP